MKLAKLQQFLVPLTAISMVFVMLIPLPSAVLDGLLAISLSASILVFLAAVQVRKATELSVFPTLLLLLTLFRLSLNLASSRMILLHGSQGTHAAGSVIEAFGQFVVGGNYVVGFVLFLALIAIQFLVVSHGAVRTAEVTARFTLDALPGKQMAIDAEMNAGLINEQVARKRREAIAREAEFYGAMDGAARFNQRDAMATILITAINIIAGLLIGTLQQGVDIAEAVKTYTILTVGDGLVTMVPSLLVSLAGGLILTRASSSASLDAEIGSQIFGRRNSLWIASGVMGALALVPGLPKISFLLVSLGLALFARRAPSGVVAEGAEARAEGTDEKKTKPTEDIAGLIPLEDLTLEIGFGLIPMVDEVQGGQLLQRVRGLRKHLATELGFVVPAVHITDNLRLKPREYVISVRGNEVGRWQMEGELLLAVHGSANARPLHGVETVDPAFGVPARWITTGLEEEALAAGYSVITQTAVLGTHLGELIKRNAHDLLGRAEVKRLLDTLNDSYPKLVEELVPKLLSLGEVHRVLQQLLRERVSIRDLGTILEAMTEMAASNRSTVALVEAARQAMGRRLVRPYLDANGALPAISLKPETERGVLASFEPEVAQRLLGSGGSLPGPETLRQLIESVKRLSQTTSIAATPVLLCASPARYHMRRWLEPLMPQIAVLAPAEIPPEVRVRSLGMIG